MQLPPIKILKLFSLILFEKKSETEEYSFFLFPLIFIWISLLLTAIIFVIKYKTSVAVRQTGNYSRTVYRRRNRGIAITGIVFSVRKQTAAQGESKDADITELCFSFICAAERETYGVIGVRKRHTDGKRGKDEGDLCGSFHCPAYLREAWQISSDGAGTAVSAAGILLILCKTLQNGVFIWQSNMFL